MRDRSLCKIVEKSVSLYGVHITADHDPDCICTYCIEHMIEHGVQRGRPDPTAPATDAPELDEIVRGVRRALDERRYRDTRDVLNSLPRPCRITPEQLDAIDAAVMAYSTLSGEMAPVGKTRETADWIKFEARRLGKSTDDTLSHYVEKGRLIDGAKRGLSITALRRDLESGPPEPESTDDPAAWGREPYRMEGTADV